VHVRGEVRTSYVYDMMSSLDVAAWKIRSLARFHTAPGRELEEETCYVRAAERYDDRHVRYSKEYATVAYLNCRGWSTDVCEVYVTYDDVYADDTHV
jgi:hypothetical protein